MAQGRGEKIDLKEQQIDYKRSAAAADNPVDENGARTAAVDKAAEDEEFFAKCATFVSHNDDVNVSLKNKGMRMNDNYRELQLREDYSNLRKVLKNILSESLSNWLRTSITNTISALCSSLYSNFDTISP